jgi:hypothetical protein
MGYPMQQVLERGNLDILILLFSLLLAYLLSLRFQASLAELVNAGAAGLISFPFGDS